MVNVDAEARRWHGLDLDRIERALARAEATTSAEIRVAVSDWYFWGSTRRAAERAFRRLRMAATRNRNAVLLFLALRRRRFELLGDVAVDQRMGVEGWNRVAAALSDGLSSDDLTAGLERGIGVLAVELARCFPAAAENPNELPDTVSTDAE